MKPRLVLTGRIYSNPSNIRGIYGFLRTPYSGQIGWNNYDWYFATEDRTFEYRVVTAAQNKSLTQAQD
jgi:hypothetical protein